MKHILFPTDFSENAWKAIQYGIALLKNEECKFYILYALEPQASAPSAGITSKRANQMIHDSRTKESQDGLNKTLSKVNALPKNDKHAFEIRLANNYFYSAVKAYVEKLNIDVVILGTKGASGIKEVTIGSNTANLINKLTCPILAVPEFAASNKISEIGFATDFSIDHFGTGINLLKDVAKDNHAKISVIHIVNNNKEMTPELLSNKKLLETTLSPIELDFYTLTDIPVELGIRAFTESRRLNMLCVISKKRSFFSKLFTKSHSKAVSHNLDVPLIVFDQKAFTK